jgi:hypothetical protein
MPNFKIFFISCPATTYKIYLFFRPNAQVRPIYRGVLFCAAILECRYRGSSLPCSFTTKYRSPFSLISVPSLRLFRLSFKTLHIDAMVAAEKERRQSPLYEPFFQEH